jgi:hypothetical protein
MSSYQQSLDGQSIETKHLSREKRARSPSSLQANPERNEWWCKDCGNRITVSREDTDTAQASISKEYGHELHCQHHIHDGEVSR